MKNCMILLGGLLFSALLFSKALVVIWASFLVAGLFFLARYSVKHTWQRLNISTELMKKKGFSGEGFHYIIRFTNNSRLPVFWCEVLQNFLPALGGTYHKILLNIEPGQQENIAIDFIGENRGRYQLPDILLRAGDPWGIFETKYTLDNINEKVIIYPPISQLSNYAKLKALFIDNVDFIIVLNLCKKELFSREYLEFMELSIELAASLFSMWIKNGSRVGFYCNGTCGDTAVGNGEIIKISQETGDEQLEEILTILAQLSLGNTCNSDQLLKEVCHDLANHRAYNIIFITPFPGDKSSEWKTENMDSLIMVNPRIAEESFPKSSISLSVKQVYAQRSSYDIITIC